MIYSNPLCNVATIVIIALQIQTAATMATTTTMLLFSASSAAVSSRRFTRTAAAFYLSPPRLLPTKERQIWIAHHRHSSRSHHHGGVIHSSRSHRGGVVLSAAYNTSNNKNSIIDDNHTSTSSDSSSMDHMLYRINEMNSIPDDVHSSLIDFVVDGHVLGRVTPRIAQLLININGNGETNQGIFELSSSSCDGTDEFDRHPLLARSPTTTTTTTTYLTLGKAAGTTFDQRTQSVSKVMMELHNLGIISGWRNELYPVSDAFDNSKQPIFLIERAAVPMLGLLEYGVHINGLVMNNHHDQLQDGNYSQNNNNQGTQMWMARRSQTKSKYPGFVDHIVAGGQPYGLSLMENVIKECMEEAGIPSDLAQRGIRPAGAVSYETYSPITAAAGSDDNRHDQGRGWGVMHRVVIFCFDLYLPQDFVPKAVDGEVDSFFLWSIADILKSMDPNCTDPIKPNCYLVIIDYLIRSGAVSSDNPKYLEILRKLRSGPCC